MLDARQPRICVKAKSSRALLREIERAAIEASSSERDLEAQVATNACRVAGSVLEDLEAQAKVMREQVDSFLEQQLHEATRQVEEAQEAQHLLQGCLSRVKEEPLQFGMARKKARILRGARARSTPPHSTMAQEASKENLDKTNCDAHMLAKVGTSGELQLNTATNEEKKETIDIDKVVCDTYMLIRSGRSEELCHQHVQLKIDSEKLQADAVAAEQKSEALQLQVDALLEELYLKPAPKEEKKENLDIDKFVCESYMLMRSGRSEELCHQHVQLKLDLEQCQADAVNAEQKSDELQVQVDALLQENAQLSHDLSESQKESDELMYMAASKEKLLTTCMKEQQERIERLQLERAELQQSLTRRGDANAVIRCLDSLQRDYDKLAHEHALLQQVAPAGSPFAKFSARAVSTDPLVLGIEAEEEEAAHDDVTEVYTSALADNGCRQAFRMGCMKVPINAGSVPVCAKIELENDGDVPWPQTAAAVLVRGDAFGCPLMSLDPAAPGQRLDLSADLLVPSKAEPAKASSMWAVVDAATGKPLGPLLVFEVVWTQP